MRRLEIPRGGVGRLTHGVRSPEAAYAAERAGAQASRRIQPSRMSTDAGRLWLRSSDGSMLKHLAQRPESGLLGWGAWPGCTLLLLSYWRDVESLHAVARDPRAPHLEPWRTFMRTAGKDDKVGIWHETYVVGPGRAESVYVNMPDFGMGRVIGRVPVTGANATAAKRLAART